MTSGELRIVERRLIARPAGRHAHALLAERGFPAAEAAGAVCRLRKGTGQCRAARLEPLRWGCVVRSSNAPA